MTGNDVSARDRQHLWAGDGRRLPGDRVVAESWRRAEMCGLDPGRVQQRQWDVDTDSRFLRHVRPVLDSLSTRLDGSDTSVMIADPQGRIVWRWAENPEHLRMLDRNLVCVGFDHSEEWLGTNGAGTALEVSRQVAIVGDEHFAYAMRDFACYAATVRHPVTHRVLGVADITSAASNASPLLGAILAGVIDDMGRVLLEAASVAERELLTRFLLERRRSQRPVVSVGEDFLLDLEVTRDTTFNDDLALESIEFVALSEKLQRSYGERVDFPDFIAGMDLEQIMTMTVGDLVSHIESRLS